jgi:hypothetical protein
VERINECISRPQREDSWERGEPRRNSVRNEDPDDRLDEDVDELVDELDEEDDSPLDDNVIRPHRTERDPDEVEADEELLLDRKELNELGSELDNPDGFADE